MTNATNGASGARQTTPERYRIDVHHHFWLARHAVERGITNARQRLSYETTPASAIEDMDRGGVSTAMLSSTLLSVWFGDREHYRRTGAAPIS